MTEVDIANMALSNIGVTTQITSLDGEEKAAQVCKLWYAQSRDELLEAHPWPFARRRKVLVQLEDVERTGWTYVYEVPTDCLVPRFIWSGIRNPRYSEEIPYAIEDDGSGNRLILTDKVDAELIYTARIDTPNSFSPLFARALAWHLASNIAMPLSVKPELKALAEQQAARTAAQAAAAAHNQEQEDVPLEAEHIAVR